MSGEYIQFRCLVQGNLCSLDLSLTSYWKVDFPPYQDHNSTYISDNSTDPYRIAVYQTSENCVFTNQLTILEIPAEWNNNITVPCGEHLQVKVDKPVTYESSCSLSKF